MKKVDHYVPDIEGNREKVLRLQSEFIKNGIEPDDLVDGNKRPKWRNIRLNEEGQITVIDYGNFSILGQTIKRKDR